MSSAREREREEKREKEREKILKRPDAKRRQTQKLSQHGRGIWPSAARATKATAVDTGVVPSLPPSPLPSEPSWSTLLLAWLWLWGVQRSNIKSYECLVSFVPKCGLQVFPTSFSPVFYLPAPATCLPTCCSSPFCPTLPALPFAFCYLRKFMR